MNFIDDILFTFDESTQVTGQLHLTEGWFVSLEVRSRSVACPFCNSVSSRPHSHYTRRVNDLPVGGEAVYLIVHSRKWFCDEPLCDRKVFAERLNWIRPSGRRTERLEALLREISLSNNCLTAEKICRSLRIPISHDALLNRIRKEPLPASENHPFCRNR